jgi:hypothetical protein
MKKLISFITQLWDKTFFSSNWDYIKWRDREIQNYERKIITKKGFFLKYYGRAGYLYYVENGNMCRIDSEYSTGQNGIWIAFDLLKEWYLPVKKEMTEAEKEEIRLKLISWLKKKRIKADLF